MKVLHLLYSLGTLNQIKSSQGNNSASRYYTNIDLCILNVFKCNSPNTYWKGLFPYQISLVIYLSEFSQVFLCLLE